MAALLSAINMATQFQSGSEFHLISSNYEHEIPQNNYRETDRSKRKYLIIFKSIQVILLLISLILLITGSKLVEKALHTDFVFIIHGAFLMFPIMILTNPTYYSTKNIIGYNLAGVIFILTNGAMLVAHWIQIQQQLTNTKMKMDSTTHTFHQMKAISGLLQVLTGFLYLLETVLFLLWDYSQ